MSSVRDNNNNTQLAAPEPLVIEKDKMRGIGTMANFMNKKDRDLVDMDLLPEK
jgi:hypothetical protein